MVVEMNKRFVFYLKRSVAPHVFDLKLFSLEKGSFRQITLKNLNCVIIEVGKLSKKSLNVSYVFSQDERNVLCL
jgi:hypothetical protein